MDFYKCAAAAVLRRRVSLSSKRLKPLRLATRAQTAPLVNIVESTTGAEKNDKGEFNIKNVEIRERVVGDRRADCALRSQLPCRNLELVKRHLRFVAAELR